MSPRATTAITEKQTRDEKRKDIKIPIGSGIEQPAPGPETPDQCSQTFSLFFKI
jgi:hypothetical protein